MIIQTRNKWDAIRAFINLWLKDQKQYCNYCGKAFSTEHYPCCENPQIGRNIDHTKGIIKQNKERQETAKNVYGANDAMNLRFAVSLPPRLLFDLEKYVEGTGNGKLFNNITELHEFAREFKVFCVPEKI